MTVYVGNHPKYSLFVEQNIRAYIKSKGSIKNISDDMAKRFLDDLAWEMNKFLMSNPKLKIDDLFEYKNL